MAADKTVAVAGALVVVDGKSYDVRRGQSTADLPSGVVSELEKMGALVSSEEDAGVLGLAATAPENQPPDDPALVNGPEGSSSGASLPDDAPDAADADVATLAAYIDSADLNAKQTVALAKDDPALASKVLDAESTAQGGDSRKSVSGPLEKLAGSGS